MIRTKNPGGGNISPDQWNILDGLSSKWANGTLRITTRECFQFHGIGKKNLWNLVNEMNKNLNGKIQTNISELKNYCKAEEYHQKYLEKKGI